jgi:hypothetical protein
MQPVLLLGPEQLCCQFYWRLSECRSTVLLSGLLRPALARWTLVIPSAW